MPRSSTGCTYTPRPTAAPMWRSSNVGQFAARDSSSCTASRSRSRDRTRMQLSCGDHSCEDDGGFRVAECSRHDATSSPMTDGSRQGASSPSSQQNSKLASLINPALQSCMMDLQNSILHDQTQNRHYRSQSSGTGLYEQTLADRISCNNELLRICNDLARIQHEVGQLK